MSDVVGNPKDRFSHDGAHYFVSIFSPFDFFILETVMKCHIFLMNFCLKIYQPRCEKTGLRGFRPGPIQTRLYSDRRWLEA